MADPTPHSISPAPTDEEAVAIVAALEAAWPRAGVEESRESAPRWKWSGRWWTKPMVARRDRPY